MAFDLTEVRRLLELQHGVISRRQVRSCGGDAHDVRRMIRRREWARVHPGVYVDHTGSATWIQRAQAAVLYAGPRAALDRESALRAEAGPGWRGVGPEDPIRVAVDVARTVRPVPGVIVRRVAALEEKVRWNATPPRMRFEHATVDVALSGARDDDVIEVLAAAVRSRRTAASRLIEVIAARARVPRRQRLMSLLEDIGTEPLQSWNTVTSCRSSERTDCPSDRARRRQPWTFRLSGPSIA